MRVALRNVILPCVALAACASPIDGGSGVTGPGGKTDSSAVAVFVDMEFDGVLLSDRQFGLESQIESQLFYTVGHLNGNDSVARLDKTQLTNVSVEEAGEGQFRITYHAKLQVGWGQRNNVPQTYRLRLPASTDYETFYNRYKDSCLDWGAHDTSAGIMWYYYRPNRSGCNIAAEDVLDVTATVAESNIGTTGMYPEYEKIWEDDALRIVAIFGKYEEGTTTSGDSGISAYNEFIETMTTSLASPNIVGDGASEVTTSPAELPEGPGVAAPDVTFSLTLADGKTIEVVAMLVDSIRNTSRDFDMRYEALTERADFVAYNGHAGLGANVRALANKGRWVRGQYAIVFINGCDTYTYISEALNDAHANVNRPEDPNAEHPDPHGTLHLDTVTNAMPAYFASMSGGSVAFIHAFIGYTNSSPKTYEQIFGDIDDDQVVIVSGEQDNRFDPNNPGAGIF